MKTVIVEFLGMPGAGKSTLSRRVEELLRAAGVPARIAEHMAVVDLYAVRYRPGGLFRRLRRALRMTADAVHIGARFPGVVAQHLRLLFNVRYREAMGLGFYDVVNSFLLGGKRRIRIARGRARPGVHLVDDGVYCDQIAHALMDEADAALVAERAARLVGSPHVVVMVRCPFETLLQRLGSRASTRFKYRDAEKRLRWVRGRFDVAGALMAAIESRPVRPPRLGAVLVQTDDSPLEQNAQRVAGTIATAWRGA